MIVNRSVPFWCLELYILHIEAVSLCAVSLRNKADLLLNIKGVPGGRVLRVACTPCFTELPVRLRAERMSALPARGTLQSCDAFTVNTC